MEQKFEAQGRLGVVINFPYEPGDTVTNVDIKRYEFDGRTPRRIDVATGGGWSGIYINAGGRAYPYVVTVDGERVHQDHGDFCDATAFRGNFSGGTSFCGWFFGRKGYTYIVERGRERRKIRFDAEGVTVIWQDMSPDGWKNRA